MPPEIDIFSATKGTVTAPAGCGKTQLITDTLKSNTQDKPVLVLTHTNAGKSALESRLAKAAVPKSAYRVSTIDSWAIRMISKFPMRSGHSPGTILLNNSSLNYPGIREAARGLMKSGAINDALRATYSRLIVDEYQDCNIPQHYIIGWASRALPTCVLGDPLQAIFDFNGPTVHWKENVQQLFPSLGVLNTPWRWNNAGAQPLGNWLLEIRECLLTGSQIDLRNAPDQVTWIKLPNDKNEADKVRLEAARTRGTFAKDTVLIIGDSINPGMQRFVARSTPGATTVEAVDFRDLTNFGRTFDLTAPSALDSLFEFSSELMTNLGLAELRRRIKTLSSGRAKKDASLAEAAVLSFVEEPSIRAALDVLCAFENEADVRVYRPEVLNLCKAAMLSAAQGTGTFSDAVVAARERNRHQGRPISRRSVGSTLLLKGLEADVAVILNPATMNSRNLYVAITRGAKKLVICAESPILRPQ